jgi:ketosteroid isomerase-like protein
MRRSWRAFAVTGTLTLLFVLAGCSGQGGRAVTDSASEAVTSSAPLATAADSESIIRAYLAAINEEDFEAAAALFAPDAVKMSPTGAGPPQTLATAADVAAYLETESPDCQHELIGSSQVGEHTLAAVVVSGVDCPVAAGTEIEIPFRIIAGRIDCICPPD